MKWLVFSFVLLFSLPLVLAALYCKFRPSKVLHIQQDYVRDPRYFGNSFRKKVRAALPVGEDRMLKLSRQEHCLFPGDLQSEEPTVKEPVLALEGAFAPQESYIFEKEIYAAEDAALPENTRFRALCGEKNVTLAPGCRCLRWADGEENLTVAPDCDLGLSASAGRLLTLRPRTRFQRLYAPEIRMALSPSAPAPAVPRELPSKRHMEMLHDLRSVSEHQTDEQGHLKANLITRHNLRILEGLTVEGDISGDWGVRVMKNAVVYGNIFAGADVLLEEGAWVYGSIFSQGSVRLGKGAGVGIPGEISSLIARLNMECAGENRVYGYVSAGTGGKLTGEEEKAP